MFLDQFIDEMCRCRTSMEHYRVKNYLVKTGEISDWKHKEDVCKWCAYPKSKKCWMCQNHWKKATDNFHGPDKAHRVRNEQIDMSCYIYVKAVKNGKVSIYFTIFSNFEIKIEIFLNSDYVTH